jgi:tetratricopeptide (TPR) repeat protein
VISVFITLLALMTGLGTPESFAEDDPLAQAIERFNDGDNTTAARLFEAHLRSNGSDARARFFLARIAIREDQIDDAIDGFREATELAPKNSDYMRWLGDAYVNKLQNVSMFKQMGYAKKAKAAFLKAVELDPENVGSREALFRYYIEAPRIAGGSESKAFEQVNEIKSRDPRAGHFALAGYYEDKEKYDEAEKEYRAVLAMAPGDPGALSRLGRVASNREDYATALELYSQILDADPDNLSTLYAFGRTSAVSGMNSDRGIEFLTRYLAADPPNNLPAHTWAHWRLGMIYANKGDTAKARNSFKASLAADPENKEAKKALKELS